ncbi:unnamed protein product, partial [Rotaria socialis]
GSTGRCSGGDLRCSLIDFDRIELFFVGNG